MTGTAEVKATGSERVQLYELEVAGTFRAPVLRLLIQRHLCQFSSFSTSCGEFFNLVLAFEVIIRSRQRLYCCV